MSISKIPSFLLKRKGVETKTLFKLPYIYTFADKVNYFRILMVEMKGNDMGVGNQGKKRILPTDISHKFSSKEDFLNFFSKQVGLSIF